MPITSYMPWNWCQSNEIGESKNCPISSAKQHLHSLEDNLARFGTRLYGDCGVIKPSHAPWPFGGPSADIVETEDALHITVDVPGLTEKDLDLTLHRNVMIIKGERENPADDINHRVHVSERQHGSFERRIRIRSGFDTTQAEAIIKHGILTVSFPRTKIEKTSVTVKT